MMLPITDHLTDLEGGGCGESVAADSSSSSDAGNMRRQTNTLARSTVADSQPGKLDHRKVENPPSDSEKAAYNYSKVLSDSLIKASSMMQHDKRTKGMPNDDQLRRQPKVAPGTIGMLQYDEFDVLCGRGGGTNLHPGNRNFRDVINKFRLQYLQSKKNDKPAISRAIIAEVRDSGGRFLKKKGNLWFEIGDDGAREKVSQALRQRAPQLRRMFFASEHQESLDVAEEVMLREEQQQQQQQQHQRHHQHHQQQQHHQEQQLQQQQLQQQQFYTGQLLGSPYSPATPFIPQTNVPMNRVSDPLSANPGAALSRLRMAMSSNYTGQEDTSLFGLQTAVNFGLTMEQQQTRMPSRATDTTTAVPGGVATMPVWPGIVTAAANLATPSNLQGPILHPSTAAAAMPLSSFSSLVRRSGSMGVPPGAVPSLGATVFNNAPAVVPLIYPFPSQADHHSRMTPNFGSPTESDGELANNEQQED